jgi:hypothetical protein
MKCFCPALDRANEHECERFLLNDLILKMTPLVLEWNRQIKKWNTRLFTGTQ